MNRLVEVQRLRGIAVLLVMIHHTHVLRDVTGFKTVGAHGWVGVDLFFAISGFVVTLSLLRLLPVEIAENGMAAFDASRAALRTFYVRRIYRLLPMVLFAIGLHLLLSRFLPRVYGTTEDLGVEAAAVLTGTFNYVMADQPFKRMGPFWSLTVEEHFYLVLPIMLVLARTRGRRLAAALMVILVVALVVRPFVTPADNWAGWRALTHRRMDALMVGVVLALMGAPADVPSAFAPWVRRYVLVPGTLVLMCYLPGQLPPATMHSTGYTVLSLMSVGLVALAARDRGDVFAWPGVGRFLAWVGERSYVIYLVHLPLVDLREHVRQRAEVLAPWPWLHDGTPGALAQVALNFGGIFLLSHLLHAWLEQPMMDAGRRLGDPLTGPAGNTAYATRHPGLVALARGVVVLGAAGAAWSALDHAFQRVPAWRAEFHPNREFAGNAVRRIYPAIQQAWSESPVPGIPAENYSARFGTCLSVPSNTRVEFDLDSDDSSILIVDGARIIDNSGNHGPRSKKGQLMLTAGVHHLQVDYVQYGGTSALSLSLEMVDATPRRHVPGTWYALPRPGVQSPCVAPP